MAVSDLKVEIELTGEGIEFVEFVAKELTKLEHEITRLRWLNRELRKENASLKRDNSALMDTLNAPFRNM